MKSTHSLSVIATALVFSVSLARAQKGPDPSARAGEIPNWPAPGYWSPPGQPVSVQGREGGVRTEAVDALPTSPLPFIGITPCRIADTRQAGFPAGYGPPALTGGVPRNFTLTGQCGIPSLAAAVSLNVTVTNTQGPGFILIYPEGGAQPNVSTLNYVAGQTVANAAVVPLGTGGGITVIAGVSGTDLILDTNGYYAGAGAGDNNTFLGLDAGNFTMTGYANTGIGAAALTSNTTGIGNTGTGAFALGSNTTGFNNTGIGVGALGSNATGNYNTGIGASALGHSTADGFSFNTGIGAFALGSNTTGAYNTATGGLALVTNTTGGGNTATGASALYSNTMGSGNTAFGDGALYLNITGGSNTALGTGALSNTTGDANTATGSAALAFNTTGIGNIALGNYAGFNLTTGSDNICIGNTGVAGESNTIRIGTAQTATFMAGIYNADATSGSAVFVTPSGKLGTTMTVSSRRFKEDIRDIAEESDGLMRLRPVAFKFKPQVDPTGLTQYGLIAEEVADVYPDLVAYDRDGRPETVRYHLVNALLLNEVQKRHRTAEVQEKTIEQQQAEIEGLKARLSRLEARLPTEPRP